jgi:hypothetical protein
MCLTWVDTSQALQRSPSRIARRSSGHERMTADRARLITDVRLR